MASPRLSRNRPAAAAAHVGLWPTLSPGSSAVFCIANMKRTSSYQLLRAEPPHEPVKTALMAADFRRLMSDHEHQEALHRQEYRRAAAEARRLRVADLIDHHISEESWRRLAHEARQAAERGE